MRSPTCSLACLPEFCALDSARAGPVSRDPHAAVRLSAVLAGRPDADGALGRGALPVPRRGRGRARELAAAAYKLRVLDEKHVLKRVAEPVVPPEIVPARSSPIRAPDALSFVADDAPAYIAEVAFGDGDRARQTSSIPGRRAPALASAGRRPRPATATFPTPTTWRWSACSRPSSCTSSSSRTVPAGTPLIELTVDVDREHRAEAALAMMHGPVPLLHDYLIHSARRLGDKVALVCGKQRVTYGELEARSNALAHTWSAQRRRARRSRDRSSPTTRSRRSSASGPCSRPTPWCASSTR